MTLRLFSRISIGRGLLRVYLVLWLLLIFIALSENYRYVLTYLGSDYWQLSKVEARYYEEQRKRGCFPEPTHTKCPPGEPIFSFVKDSTHPMWGELEKTTSVVGPETAREKTFNVFWLALLGPIVFLVFAVGIYRLLKWAMKGFLLP